jgi:ubiquinone/menaquinone biosynthesis C-methylase UbiE
MQYVGVPCRPINQATVGLEGAQDMAGVDAVELETKVKDIYRQVAEQPFGAYHFEMGRTLAERLGYPSDLLDQIPAEAIESFAGVGYFLDLAGLQPGERVLDLGSGSGTDSFAAAALVGASGLVVGVDFTAEQLTKARRIAEARWLVEARRLVDARRLATPTGPALVEFREGRIEALPAVDDDSMDCVISNGVINLSPDKDRVFAEAARVLRVGGRLAIADIVTERQLTDAIVGNADLWASCIGGASQQDAYRQGIENAGLRIEQTRPNQYRFISDQARDASASYGVHSISLLAVKPVR